MYWILFRRETDNAYYFWASTYIICVQAADGHLIADNIWGRSYQTDLDNAECTRAAKTKGTSRLKFSGDFRRYIIEAKGKFIQE